MNGPALVSVLTTIQPPPPCVRSLAAALARVEGQFLVLGDRKGPAQFPLPGADYYPLEAQRRLPFRLAGLLPVDHYTRKNLGYLLAVAAGAASLYETDD